MSTGPGGGYMMSNCSSVYSISADGGVYVEREAFLCPCAPMYRSSVPLQKRLVGRLASSRIVKIFPFPLSQPSLQPYHTLVRPSLLLRFFLSTTPETSRASEGKLVWVMSRMVGLGLRCLLGSCRWNV